MKKPPGRAKTIHARSGQGYTMEKTTLKLNETSGRAFQNMFASALTGRPVVIAAFTKREIGALCFEITLEQGPTIVGAIERLATVQEFALGSNAFLGVGEMPEGDQLPNPSAYYAVKFGIRKGPDEIEWVTGEDFFTARIKKLQAHVKAGFSLIAAADNAHAAGDVLLECKAGRVIVLRRSTRDEFVLHATREASLERRPFYYECKVEPCGS